MNPKNINFQTHSKEQDTKSQCKSHQQWRKRQYEGSEGFDDLRKKSKLISHPTDNFGIVH